MALTTRRPGRSAAARSRARAGTTARTRTSPPRPDARAADVGRALGAVRRIVRGLRLAEQRTRSEAGLSAAQLFVLTQLSDASAASLGDLATRTMTDRTSVAAVVERLEEAGLAASERDAADRRRVLVRITEGGRRRLRTAPEPPTVMLVHALERLPRAELRALALHLGHLVEEMGLADEPEGMLFEDRPAGRRTARRRDG